MNAGRELDTLVAEIVMGKGESKTIGGIYVGPPEYEREAQAKLHADVDKVPHYSTDISAALAVKDRMVEDGFSFSLFESRTGAIRVSFICPAGPCEKHGNFQHNHHGAYDVEADTVPLAICEAALIALKISMEKT